MRKIIFLILFSYNLGFSQSVIGISANCLNHNSAQLTKVLHETVGKSVITNWLENNIRFGLICEIDSTGVVKSINHIYPSYININKRVLKKIEKNIKKKKVRFKVCYSDPGLSKENLYKQASHEIKELFRKNTTINNSSISFPGNLMELYRESMGLSRFEYLMNEVCKYL